MKMDNLLDAFQKLAKLAKDLQLNLTQVNSRQNETYPKKIRQNANDIWDVLSPVLCGTPYHSKKGETGESKEKTMKSLFEGRGESTHALKIMLYTLTNDPMILYSPNGTEADLVMKKVNIG